jgi:hypothetical protein
MKSSTITSISLAVGAALSLALILPQLVQDPLPLTAEELGFCERMLSWLNVDRLGCFIFHKAGGFANNTLHIAAAGTLLGLGINALMPQQQPQAQQRTEPQRPTMQEPRQEEQPQHRGRRTRP